MKSFKEYIDLDEGTGTRLAKTFQSLLDQRVQMTVVTSKGEFKVKSVLENERAGVTFRTDSGDFNYSQQGKPAGQVAKEIKIAQR